MHPTYETFQLTKKVFAMKKYTVNSPLNHDNQAYAIGDTVEMSEEQAAHLVARERITPVAEKAAPVKVEGSETHPAGADADTPAAGTATAAAAAAAADAPVVGAPSGAKQVAKKPVAATSKKR